jgi:hypothetical protein
MINVQNRHIPTSGAAVKTLAAPHARIIQVRGRGAALPMCATRASPLLLRLHRLSLGKSRVLAWMIMLHTP